MQKSQKAGERLSRPPLARMLHIHRRLKANKYPN